MSPRSEAPPEDEHLVQVVAAVIERNGQLLIARRPAEKRHGGLWEFPGGKLREGESLQEAARRELAEELGLEALAVGPVVFDARDPGTPFLVRFVHVIVEDTPPRPSEHDAVAWLSPDQIRDLPLAPSDASFVSQYLGAV
jgi:(d)CTP diphosphatase